MRKNRAQEIVIHDADSGEARAAAGRVSAFHAGLIARRLRQSSLTAEERAAVLDRVVAILRSKDEYFL